MKFAVRAMAELGEGLVLAPERHVVVAAAREARGGVLLGDLVVERRERAEAGPRTLVLDTTHARDGILDVGGALATSAPPAKSAKKAVRAGDVVVSRLRPYLRQVALVDPIAVKLAAPRALALSTEFYVLAAKDSGDDLAFLVPFLLSTPVQSILAAAQEGGHHPRVPRSSLLALRVPSALVRARAAKSREVRRVLASVNRAYADWRALLGQSRRGAGY